MGGEEGEGVQHVFGATDPDNFWYLKSITSAYPIGKQHPRAYSHTHSVKVHEAIGRLSRGISSAASVLALVCFWLLWLCVSSTW